jgi:hypothetical protein
MDTVDICAVGYIVQYTTKDDWDRFKYKFAKIISIFDIIEMVGSGLGSTTLILTLIHIIPYLTRSSQSLAFSSISLFKE